MIESYKEPDYTAHDITQYGEAILWDTSEVSIELSRLKNFNTWTSHPDIDAVILIRDTYPRALRKLVDKAIAYPEFGGLVHEPLRLLRMQIAALKIPDNIERPISGNVLITKARNIATCYKGFFLSVWVAQHYVGEASQKIWSVFELPYNL